MLNVFWKLIYQCIFLCQCQSVNKNRIIRNAGTVHLRRTLKRLYIQLHKIPKTRMHTLSISKDSLMNYRCILSAMMSNDSLTTWMFFRPPCYIVNSSIHHQPSVVFVCMLPNFIPSIYRQLGSAFLLLAHNVYRVNISLASKKIISKRKIN